MLKKVSKRSVILKRVALILAFILMVPASFSGIPPKKVAAVVPRTGGVHTQAQFTEIKQKITSSEQPYLSSYNTLITKANEALNLVPSPVQSFVVPGIYVDPNGHNAAKEPLNNDAYAAYRLALAYRLDAPNKISYANKAIEILNAWASTNTFIGGDDSPLVMSNTGVCLIYAADMLYDYTGWSTTDKNQFMTWTQNVFRVSTNGIRGRVNNWSDWGVLASLEASYVLGDEAGIQENILFLKNNIDSQIGSDGTMPEETRRGDKGLWYTYFSLAPMTQACQIVLNVTGENIYTYVSPNGKTIKAALDYLFIYAQNPSAWPYGTQSSLPSPSNWPGNLFEAMANVYNDTSYFNWISASRPIVYSGSGRGAWSYSTLFAPPSAPWPPSYISSTGDATVKSTAGTTNFGTSTTLDVNAGSEINNAYLKFNFSALQGTNYMAKVRVNIASVGADAVRTIKIYGVTDESWSQSSINYNNAPTAGTYITSVNVSNKTGAWYEFDVTNYVKNHMQDKIVAFKLVNEGTGTAGSLVSFVSSEGDAKYKPVLEMRQPLLNNSTPVPVVNTATHDAYVRDGTYASTNYGTTSGLQIKAGALNSGYTRKSFLKFDISNRAGTTVSAAKLKLKADTVGTDASRTIRIYGITNNTWTEGTITWDNAPSTNRTLITSFNVSNTAGTVYEIDITSYIASHLSDGYVTLELVNEGTATSNCQVTFVSREGAVGKPELVIN